jgi:formimidoylglutamate deiminase
VGEFHYVHDGSPELLLRHLAAAQEAGIAITLLPCVYRWSNFGRKPLQPRQRRFDSDPAFVLRLLDGIAVTPDLRRGVAPHSLRAVDPAELTELVAGLPADAAIHIHAAEQTREVDECVAALGKRPVEWLLANMRLDARWCLVHATHMTAGEAAALAKSGATAALCPTTEANLGDGIFPLPAYRAAGGRYGIAGDSHVSRDPAEELRLLEYAQRLTARRRNRVATDATPAIGTTLWLEAAAGAPALGRRMGAIAPGMRADLVVLDADHADLAGRGGDAIANALIFSGGSGMVRDVMVGGAWAVREGAHARQETARAAYKKAVSELLSGGGP